MTHRIHIPLEERTIIAVLIAQASPTGFTQNLDWVPYQEVRHLSKISYHMLEQTKRKAI
jgi:hypothetical protein